MATVETKIKGMEIEYPKPKTSLSLCCFGSFHSKTPTRSKHKTKQESGTSSSWFPWQRIRFRVKNSMAKTVPLEGSEFDETDKLKLKLKANKVHSSWCKWKSKSKSDLLNKTLSNSKPSQTPSKSRQNRGNNIEGDRRQQSKSSSSSRKGVPHAVSLPTSKKQNSQTTWKHGKHKQLENAERYNYNPVAAAAASVVVITLVSMIVWGRFCSIICTSAWLYLILQTTWTRRETSQDIM
ncbi:hypothetical protein AAZX31_11G098800 [Glycine max]|uniref:Uncharacterized protein n=2 Tax=Glycine subgen. Soja TaxID=1462606 RepID=I1LIS0_SOYBN|nr:uncharacterized protein LOC100783481 [Glycine max]XP_028189307.1 uncharacterized protein LOC114375658 [Glycine soja]KAG4993841.1 hypothetical protein JHK86_030668 [Glycine max]KAH1158416.1 hypothetical protein GYH30_030594 [Glycine max]KAH1224327.1 hypothetical protein GmHk_11G031548 [Glycine max]KHN32291.1 hypothetical protein glysoja_039154 [Glycine soja]KRH29138.1 hypothetical protein GLYMA_11G100200v4 [Glycine max]|eukprot:XP_003537772.1 uncharacterized protein LOC100783481 [Glycine max]